MKTLSSSELLEQAGISIKRDAPLIIRAVNSYDELMAACQNALEVLQEVGGSHISTRSLLKQALAKAKGE